MATGDIDAGKNTAGQEVEDWLAQQIVSTMKAAAIEFYRQVIISTPVDSGRARLGWSISVNNYDDWLPPPAPGWKWGDHSVTGEKEPYYPKPDFQQYISVMAEVTPKDTIFITNRVPYINRLNNGWSKQSPGHFVEIAMAQVNNATELASLQRTDNWGEISG